MLENYLTTTTFTAVLLQPRRIRQKITAIIVVTTIIIITVAITRINIMVKIIMGRMRNNLFFLLMKGNQVNSTYCTQVPHCLKFYEGQNNNNNNNNNSNKEK